MLSLSLSSGDLKDLGVCSGLSESHCSSPWYLSSRPRKQKTSSRDMRRQGKYPRSSPDALARVEEPKKTLGAQFLYRQCWSDVVSSLLCCALLYVWPLAPRPLSP